MALGSEAVWIVVGLVVLTCVIIGAIVALWLT
jgi:hypothetical protein